MKTKHSFSKLFFAVLISALSFTSCDDDNDNTIIDPDDNYESKYIVVGSSGENDYLVTGTSVETDSIFDATSADALQSAGSSFWSFVGNKVAYGFLYNSTEAGVTGSYILNSDGNIKQRNELGLEVRYTPKEL